MKDFRFENSKNGEFIHLSMDEKSGIIDLDSVFMGFNGINRKDSPKYSDFKEWHRGKISQFIKNYTGSDKEQCKKVCTALIEQHYS